MKKICILMCGGTITMIRDKEGYLKPHNSKADLVKIVPEIVSIADIEIHEIANIDSSNISTEIWGKIVDNIQKYYQEFDGFVLVHGTDTMAYTASALSFAIQNLNKPIVLTGAQKPLSDVATDARNNLINSILVAGMSIPEVLIVFGNKILRGNRTTKVSESNFDAFESPMYPLIGEIHLKPVISSKHRIIEEGKETVFSSIFNTNVFVLKIHPGINPELINDFLTEKWSGIVIEAFGAGNIPDTLMPVLKNAQKRKIPVVITNQCHKGITRIQLYYTGYHAREFGAISALDMIPEAAVIKLMWILGKTNQLDLVRMLFHSDIAGELNEQSAD